MNEDKEDNLLSIRVDETNKSLKMPPASEEAEKRLLAGILVDNKNLDAIIEENILKPEHFYKKQNKMVYAAMLEIHEHNATAIKEKKIQIDEISIYELLNKKQNISEVGGAEYLSKLSEISFSGANTNYYSALIYEKWIRRQTVVACLKASEEAYENVKDTFEILQQTINRLARLASVPERNTTSIDSAIKEVKNIYINTKKRNGNPALLTGYPKLDLLTYGLAGNYITLVPAATKMGKTTFALNVAKNVAELNNKRVLYISLEENKRQDAIKILSSISGVDSSKFHLYEELSKEEDELLLDSFEKGSDLKIDFYDGDPNTENILNAVDQEFALHDDVCLVIIDVLQGHPVSVDNLHYKPAIYGNFIRSIKQDIAKHYDTHVLLTSQVKEEVSTDIRKYPDFRPKSISDIKDVEAGIADTVNNVIFLYRPNHYFKEKVNLDGNYRNLIDFQCESIDKAIEHYRYSKKQDKEAKIDNLKKSRIYRYREALKEKEDGLKIPHYMYKPEFKDAIQLIPVLSNIASTETASFMLKFYGNTSRLSNP
ncbi:replicative DNA helicase [Candidatus Woesearchaeota archaeon]|nr:replicative DNA helicase [Candidatus Woesearchaeota archaeon]